MAGRGRREAFTRRYDGFPVDIIIKMIMADSEDLRCKLTFLRINVLSKEPKD